MTDKELMDIKLKLNDHENEIGSLNRRMNVREEDSKTLNELAISVKELAFGVKGAIENLAKQDERIKYLENRPMRRWETVVTCLITTIIGALIGFLISILK